MSPNYSVLVDPEATDACSKNIGKSGNKISIGVIIGVVVGAVILIAVITFVIFYVYPSTTIKHSKSVQKETELRERR